MYTIGNFTIRKNGLKWGLWFALIFMLLPYIIHGLLFAYYYQKPAEDFVHIESITASDIGHDGVLYMEMCRWVDEKRTGDWTWELSLVNAVSGREERVHSNTTGAIMEVVDDCLVTWNSGKDGQLNSLVTSLEPGRYRWQVVVEFEVEYGIHKMVSAESNIFTKRTIIQ